jgi:hypothetical protein
MLAGHSDTTGRSTRSGDSPGTPGAANPRIRTRDRAVWTPANGSASIPASDDSGLADSPRAIENPTVDSPDCPALWAPQKPLSAAQLLEHLHRRAAALGARHSHHFGTIHSGCSFESRRATCLARGAITKQVARTHGAQRGARPPASARPRHGNAVARAAPASWMCRGSQRRETWRRRVTGTATLSLVRQRFLRSDTRTSAIRRVRAIASLET